VHQQAPRRAVNGVFSATFCPIAERAASVRCILVAFIPRRPPPGCSRSCVRPTAQQSNCPAVRRGHLPLPLFAAAREFRQTMAVANIYPILRSLQTTNPHYCVLCMGRPPNIGCDCEQPATHLCESQCTTLKLAICSNGKFEPICGLPRPKPTSPS